MQVSCPAGSVFIQDTRMWHSTACHNTSGRPRVATVNRWVPWWLHNSFGKDDTPPTTCDALSNRALPHTPPTT